MHSGIGLIYIEGETNAGRLTGRTILVVETSHEIDPAQPGYSSRDLRRLVAEARSEWEQRFGPADTVRLEYHPQSDRAPLPVRRRFRG